MPTRLKQYNKLFHQTSLSLLTDMALSLFFFFEKEVEISGLFIQACTSIFIILFNRA